MSLRTQVDEYSDEKEFPLGWYAGLMGVFGGCFAVLLAVGRHRLPRRLRAEDVVLTGIATHKIARILAKDWVTSPLRAPFARYQGPLPGGEVQESSRGTGLRRAIGDLVTCNYCVGPWVAAALTATYAASRRAARAVTTIFAATAVSDFLHRLYSLLEARTRESDARAEVDLLTRSQATH